MAGIEEKRQFIREVRNAQNYSDLSNANLTKLEDGMSMEEILRFLNEGLRPRTFGEILEKYCQEGLRDRLYQKLYEIESKEEEKKGVGSADSARKLSEKISRNIRNWINSDIVPGRENLFKICYALDLGYEEADELIASASETGIRLRDPDEIIYAYGLVNRLSWDHMQELKQELQSDEDGKKEMKEGRQSVYTEVIKSGFFDAAKNEKRFRRFYEMQRPQFSAMSETAYNRFMKMVQILKDRQTEGSMDQEGITEGLDEYTGLRDKKDPRARRGSVEGIVKQYGLEFPKRKRTKGRTSLQDVIEKNWPTKDVLDSMIERRRAVTRKAIILLTLGLEELEEDSLTNEEWRYIDSLAETEEELPEARMIRRMIMLNKSLETCNMKRLDPRNGFDCVVLYALRASCSDDRKTMSQKMKRTLTYLLENMDGEGKGHAATV